MKKYNVNSKIKAKESGEVSIITNIKDNKIYFLPINDSGKTEDRSMELFIDVEIFEELYDVI